MDSVDAAEAAAGPAAAEFFAGVPSEWRWMFDARSLQATFTTPDVRTLLSHITYMRLT